MASGFMCETKKSRRHYACPSCAHLQANKQLCAALGQGRLCCIFVRPHSLFPLPSCLPCPPCPPASLVPGLPCPVSPLSTLSPLSSFPSCLSPCPLVPFSSSVPLRPSPLSPLSPDVSSCPFVPLASPLVPLSPLLVLLACPLVPLVCPLTCPLVPLLLFLMFLRQGLCCHPFGLCHLLYH